MKFYDDTKPLYLETDASGIGLGAALLLICEGTACQKDIAPENTTLCPIAFASKSVTGAECRYSNIEREALGIIHGLKKFYHYCFAREVLIITDHKPLVAIFKKDVVTLLQCIQHILLKIHQYRVQIIYKPGPKIFIADWLSQHNHKEGKDKPIKDMDKKRHHTKCNMHPGMHLNKTYSAGVSSGQTFIMSKNSIIAGWPSTRDELCSDLRPYWS